MDLKKVLKDFGWIDRFPTEILGKKFSFEDGRDKIYGLITGISTTDDGLPLIEVSNKKFSGLKVVDILIVGNYNTEKNALLFTEATEPHYHQIAGNLTI